MKTILLRPLILKGPQADVLSSDQIDESPGGHIETRRRWPRARTRFVFSGVMLAEAYTELREIAHMAGSHASVWFDGGGLVTMSKPWQIAEGDGSRTEFQLPFGYPIESSWQFWDDGVLKTDWTMTHSADLPAGVAVGVVTFTAAPAGILTGQGDSMYKCLVGMSDERIVVTPEAAPGVGIYQAQLDLREVP